MERAAEKILAYWNSPDVESMYDKHLLNAEIELIRRRIAANSKILDAGCGEGEGTLAYSAVPGVTVHGVDFSETRLANRENVLLRQADLSKDNDCGKDFDFVVSQRFLINLPTWPQQQKVLLGLMSRLKPGGKLLMLEASRQGNDSLNEFRSLFGLEPILVRWHNLFFDDDKLISFMQESGFRLYEQDGLGAYFLLTRGVRPVFDSTLEWDSEFNRLAALPQVHDILGLNTKFSRWKLFVFGR